MPVVTGPVAVLGASGKTGRAVTAALLRRGVDVRAVVRRPGRLAGEEAGRTLCEVVADLDSGEGLEPAFDGCAAAYLLAPNVHPDEPGVIERAVTAARDAGVRRVVLHSVLHPHDSAMPHHLAKARAEEVVRASGLCWTVLQPCAYTQNLTASLPQVLATGRLEVPYRVDAPFTLVDTRDVGEAAAIVLSEEGHDAASYELCGPDVMTVADVAAEVARVSAREVVAVRTDPDDWLAEAGAALPQHTRETLHAMFVAYDDDGLVGGRRVLPWLLGRPSTPVTVSIDRALQAYTKATKCTPGAR
ncbi:MAG TPA: NAD(P)H-binding protein [Actinomycetales bacterium]|nr:NAD(P)H-binding protein [Actinomycetales bacterium]